MLSHESPVHGVPSGKVLGVNEEDELDALRQTIADLPGDLEDYRQLFLHVARVALRQEQSIPFAPQLEARLHELAQEIADNSPLAVQGVKDVMRFTSDHGTCD